MATIVGVISDTHGLLRPEARVYVIHSIGELRGDPAEKGYAAVVTGHSHQPREEIRDGVLYLNPGSAGPRRFELPVTVARLIVDGAKVHSAILPLSLK
jgi:uncharacterized protein